jgi:hypothetical protein
LLLSISIPDEDLHRLADLIASRLNAQAVPQAAAPVQTPPQGAMPTAAPPTYTPPPPLGPPPQINGNTKVFPPGGGHVTQQNGARDVLTGQATTPMVAPNGPAIPQMQSNAPVSVGAVPMGPTTQAAQLTQPIDKLSVQRMAMRVYNDKANNGEAVFQWALNQSGVNHMTNLNDSNAGSLFAALQAAGVQP